MHFLCITITIIFFHLFQTVASMHSYNTRFASKSTYFINTIKTNYGKFNIRFADVKVWNHLDESIKHLPLKTFKNKVKLYIVLLFISFQLVPSFSFSLSYFSLFIFCPLFFLLTDNFRGSSFSANLRPIFKHYLLLLS